MLLDELEAPWPEFSVQQTRKQLKCSSTRSEYFNPHSKPLALVFLVLDSKLQPMMICLFLLQNWLPRHIQGCRADMWQASSRDGVIAFVGGDRPLRPVGTWVRSWGATVVRIESCSCMRGWWVWSSSKPFHFYFFLFCLSLLGLGGNHLSWKGNESCDKIKQCHHKIDQKKVAWFWYSSIVNLMSKCFSFLLWKCHFVTGRNKILKIYEYNLC